ncbi:MAG: polyribonucleotide nucleotidyltransferase, partial [Chloroflexi bacterium]|nr:polyribonucleotide nucleotidyltransferase [Chloroflexota bacterium]
MTRIESSLAGQKLTLETGKLAKQAGGAVLVTHGETVVLATATLAGQAREGIDYLPLMVDYEEKMYS